MGARTMLIIVFRWHQAQFQVTFHIEIFVIFTTILRGNSYSYPCVADEETEAHVG